MKTEICIINKQGDGFQNALEMTRKIAADAGLSKREVLCLQLITEEMMGLVRSVTGENDMSFWIERENKLYQFHLSTKTVMNLEKKAHLVSSTSSLKNDAAKGFIGMLREKYQNAMLMSSDAPASDSTYMNHDVLFYNPESAEWDKYERSILQKIADEIRIGIRGSNVEMIVSKRFD